MTYGLALVHGPGVAVGVEVFLPLIWLEPQGWGGWGYNRESCTRVHSNSSHGSSTATVQTLIYNLVHDDGGATWGASTDGEGWRWVRVGNPSTLDMIDVGSVSPEHVQRRRRWRRVSSYCLIFFGTSRPVSKVTWKVKKFSFVKNFMKNRRMYFKVLQSTATSSTASSTLLILSLSVCL